MKHFLNIYSYLIDKETTRSKMDDNNEYVTNIYLQHWLQSSALGPQSSVLGEYMALYSMHKSNIKAKHWTHTLY